MSRALIVLLAFGGFAVIAALAARFFVFRPLTAPSVSMEPNIDKGDYFVVLDRPFSHAARRGDIIVFILPASGHVQFVKRVVGIPGDRVQLRAGRLYINDAPVAETVLGMGTGELPVGPQPVTLERETMADGRSYTIEVALGPEPAGDTGVYVTPAHCYFVLGDNRDNSLDSRFDPGLAPGDPKLGGCGWNADVDDKVGDYTGVGFVPESDIIGIVGWNLTRPLHEQGSPW